MIERETIAKTWLGTRKLSGGKREGVGGGRGKKGRIFITILYVEEEKEKKREKKKKREKVGFPSVFDSFDVAKDKSRQKKCRVCETEERKGVGEGKFLHSIARIFFWMTVYFYFYFYFFTITFLPPPPSVGWGGSTSEFTSTTILYICMYVCMYIEPPPRTSHYTCTCTHIHTYAVCTILICTFTQS